MLVGLVVCVKCCGLMLYYVVCGCGLLWRSGLYVCGCIGVFGLISGVLFNSVVL